MYRKYIKRLFHSSGYVLGSLNKSDLSKLRKKTGYTFANCKKALELNNHDIELAEKWLKEQGQALGWSKLAKLEGRTTAQGLVGINIQDSYGTMVEINCETDFVARNKTFASLVQVASQAFLKHISSQKPNKPLQKVYFEGKELSSLEGPDGMPLCDHVALAVSSLGENIILRRAVSLLSNGKFYMAGYTHPASTQLPNSTMLGKYGVLVSYTAPSTDMQTTQTIYQLCQHIVGMNPSKIGVIGEDEPCENKDDESVMIHQEFLLDPNCNVSQVISDMSIELIDFVRFECGEALVTNVQPAESVNTVAN